MNWQSTIDIIINQEKKEIITYVLFAITFIIGVVIVNFIFKNPTNSDFPDTKFLGLLIEYIPINQIVKRRKKINYFDKIIRIGISESESDKEDFKEMLRNAIVEGLKS